MKHEFSLSTKLSTLDVGHVIYFPDDAPMMKATIMERQITNLIAKSPKLKGRRFMTTRCDVITVGRTHEHALRVERME
jgi:hypothetical protein